MRLLMIIVLLLLHIRVYGQKETTLLSLRTYFSPVDSHFLATKENTMLLGKFADTLLWDIMTKKIPAYYFQDIGYFVDENRPYVYKKAHNKIENPYNFYVGSMTEERIDERDTTYKALRSHLYLFHYHSEILYHFKYRGKFVSEEDRVKNITSPDYTYKPPFTGKMIKKDAVFVICFPLFTTDIEPSSFYPLCYVKFKDLKKKGYKIEINGSPILVSDYLLDTTHIFRATSPKEYKFIKGGPGKRYGNNNFNTFNISEKEIICVRNEYFNRNEQWFEYFFMENDFLSLLKNPDVK